MYPTLSTVRKEWHCIKSVAAISQDGGQVKDVLSIAWLPTLFLFIVARPLSVLASFLPFRQPFRKQLFISWIGIKGATPIVFALIPLIMGVPNTLMT